MWESSHNQQPKQICMRREGMNIDEHDKDKELREVERDALIYGTGFLVDGKRVDPRKVFISIRKELMLKRWFRQILRWCTHRKGC